MFEIITQLLHSFPRKDKILLLSVYRDDWIISFNGEQSQLNILFEIAHNTSPSEIQIPNVGHIVTVSRCNCLQRKQIQNNEYI